MSESALYQNISLSARLLGALFYYPPSGEQCTTLVSALSSLDWRNEWPYGTDEELNSIAALIRTASAEPLDDAYQRLFIGPYALPAPPWGSVYLDKENVLFGDSTLALREWMSERRIDVLLRQNEPEDHFGLMMMMAAWLAELQPEELAEFLEIHLLPWAFRYLELMEQGAEHPFYQGIARLATLALRGWQQTLDLDVPPRELFR